METFDELYYKEPFAQEFDAEVVSCEPSKDGPGAFDIVLSQSAFYPLGGGQPGDRGTLALAGGKGPDAARGEAGAATPATGSDAVKEGAEPNDGAAPEPAAVHVLDTTKKGDDVIHHADGALPVGARVHGALDWTWRRDNMEAHTGEHIVSGIVHRLYGYENVGFHMGERCIEVDFDGVLSEEQALDVERRANAAIREDLPVEARVPSAAELEAMDYRSKKALEGPVRIVSIPGVDACACCGTHVATTGQVGLVKILRTSTKKKRTRLELLCGRRALLACEDEMRALRDVSNFLSVGDEEAFEAVKRLSAEKDGLKHELKQAHRAAIDQEVAALPVQDGPLIRFEEGADIDEMRHFCEQALARGVAPICAVLSPMEAGPGKDGAPRLGYVIASAGADLRPACKELNARLSGRGGGKPNMVQGSYAASAEDAEAALREVLGGLAG